MPEELELNAQRKELVNRHKVKGLVISKIKNMKKKEKANNFTVLDALQKLLPLRVADVQTRGKEIAILFSNEYKLVFCMGSGGYFGIDEESKLEHFPYNERTNFCMVSQQGKCIYVLECNNTLNQVTIALKTPEEDTFDPLRGPDPIEASLEDFEANLFHYLDDETKVIQNYFEKATLLDVLHNQSLFNGLGDYTVNEVLHWLWLLKGIRPWENGAAILRDDKLRALLMSVIKTYFTAMLDYLQPGTPHSKIDCGTFDERKWLDFRAIFLRCYRNYTAENRREEREVVAKYSRNLVGCCLMKITKTKANVYLVSLTDDEREELDYDGWLPKRNNPFYPNSLGVGMHNWWGPKERRSALDSPVKEIQQLVNIRPSTREDLYKTKSPKRKLFEIQNAEDEDEDGPERKKLKGEKQKRRRPNPRNRFIRDLHSKMKNLVTDSNSNDLKQ